MLPGQILGALPGEKVLDLCAAPGGKTVQIAAAMKGKGLLVANDNHAERVKALIRNVELYGIRNTIVLNESPERLVRNFEGYFDRIIIDAPCSGEGMFRKDETAVKSWESFSYERCTQLQEPILHSADRLLKPGGTLVYSTCTFAPEEDEQMIVKFLQTHEGYELMEIPKVAGMEGGRPQWAGGYEPVTRAARLWPHRLKGEGHFVAKLMKTDRSRANTAAFIRNAPGRAGLFDYEDATHCDSLPESYPAFIKDHMNGIPEGIYFHKGRNLYHLPEQPPKLDGLRVSKFGWFLGTFEEKRFEPSHHLVTALDRSAFRRTINLDSSGREINSYLKGETLMLEGEKGFTAVCADEWTMGWAKQTGDMLKNMYPKGWRRLS